MIHIYTRLSVRFYENEMAMPHADSILLNCHGVEDEASGCFSAALIVASTAT